MNLNLRTSNPKFFIKKKPKNKLNIKLHVNGHKHQSRFYRTCMFTLSVSNQARFSLKTDHIPYQWHKQPSHASTLSITPYTCSFHLLQCFPDIYEGPNDRNLCIS